MVAEALRLTSKVDAQRKIRELVDLRVRGGPNMLEEALKIAGAWGIEEGYVRNLFKTADRLGSETLEDGSFFRSAPQPGRVESREVVEPKPKQPEVKPEQVKPSAPRPSDQPVFTRRFGSAQPKPKPEPEPEKEPKKAAITHASKVEAKKVGKTGKEPTIGWPEEWPDAPTPPSGVKGYERLLYPLGLLGHATQYVVDTAPLPDRQLALAVSISALAKGMDRRVIGPTANSCVLFNQLLAETGAGKHHGISCSRSLLRAMGLESSIVASGLASVQAIEEIIEGIDVVSNGIDPNPNALVVIDEVGSWLSRILSKSQGGNVSEIPGILQTLWGQPVEDGWIGTKKVGKKMRTFYNVAFSIIGFSTERMFFGALEDRLISSGFVNRMLVWNIGRGALERVDPLYSWTQCPKWLMDALQQVTNLEVAPLYGPMRLPLPLVDGTIAYVKDFHRLDWGPGAKERWLKFDNEVRAMPSVDDRELWIRASDLAVRLSTVVAFYRCSATVDVSDWEWAVEVVKHSVEKLRSGINEHMTGKIEQADLAQRIRTYVKDRADEWVTIGEISKAFERKVDDVRKLNAVIWHVEKTGDIIEVPLEEVRRVKGERRGKPTTYFRWNRRGR
jgi:hypothetical protein